MMKWFLSFIFLFVVVHLLICVCWIIFRCVEWNKFDHVWYF
jgi:hypothetical protein